MEVGAGNDWIEIWLEVYIARKSAVRDKQFEGTAIGRE